MERFTAPILASLAAELWMPALVTAIVLPDICGWLETPEEKVGRRYKRWAFEHIQPKYTYHVGPTREEQVFLSASDIYALRCAITHSGLDSITNQAASESLERFKFTIPLGKNIIHCNRSGAALQLQVDIFCRDICDAVINWEKTTGASPEIISRKQDLILLW